MDPLGAITTLFSVVNYLRAASDKIKQNREECNRLADHAEAILRLIEAEVGNRAPTDVVQRLDKLKRTLLGLNSTLDQLSRQSRLKYLLWRDDIGGRIAQAYKDLSEAAQLFDFGSKVDLRRFQYENEVARRADAAEVQENFSHALGNDCEILEHLGIQDIKFQEAVIAIHNHLRNLEDSVEKQLLENGMHAMQSRSGDLKSIPDVFDITSLDVIIYRHKKIGEGGCGQVFVADWRGTMVAVKVFRLDKGTHPDLFRKEIEIWKRLRHPNILEFFGACPIADPPFSVCALKHQGDAMNYLRHNPSGDRGKIVYEASLGLDYLHKNSVVHGDLKGSNILIDEHGIACLCDFGLSKIRTHTTTVHQPSDSDYTKGTLRWMSPEQMSLGITNKKSDVYSFGMTIYEVFSGLPPFADTLDNTLYLSVVDRGLRPPRPDSPESISRGLHDSLWILIEDCWAQDAVKRPIVLAITLRVAFILSTRSNVATFGAASHQSESRWQPLPILSSAASSDVPSTKPRHLQDLTGQITLSMDRDSAYGGFSSIFKGLLTSPRQIASVAIKIPHAHDCTDAHKGLIRESTIWLTLSHPNIVPLLGVYLGHNSLPGLVSPFCDHGNSLTYVALKSVPERLRILVGVAEGLAYLHSRGIVHGDLKGSNILVNHEGIPWLCDFGRSAASPQSNFVKDALVDFATVASASNSGSIRFMAPEFFDPPLTENAENDVMQASTWNAPSKSMVRGVTESSDVYAFAMTALEIYSGKIPFFYVRSEPAVVLEVRDGGRPRRLQYESSGCPPVIDDLWKLFEGCWGPVPDSRPIMTAVVQDMKRVKPHAIQSLQTHTLHTHPASTVAHCVISGTTTTTTALQSKKSAVFDIPVRAPDERHLCKDLTGQVVKTEETYFAYGGFSEIFRGIWTDKNGVTVHVAIKLLRGIHTDRNVLELTTRRLYRESKVWHFLDHPNILPFLGICCDIGPSPALISPLCDIGNALDYVRTDVKVARPNIIFGAARGLEYLHSRDVIHGDLKPSNILIDDSGTARICDFGRSKIIDHRGYTTSFDANSRLMAPELLSFPDNDDSELDEDPMPEIPHLTKETDIYTFSMVALEILTGKLPFYYIPNDTMVIFRVQKGLRPLREKYEVPNSGLWLTLERCWNQEPKARPTMANVVRMLAHTM